jgi:hypothetical protein
MGSEGGIHGRPTQAVRHTCSGNLVIVKILRYVRSDMYTASAKQILVRRWAPWPTGPSA